MALRNIENALPISQERPKKLPKLSKNPEICLNDENNIVPPPESTIDYVASENLKPFPDPESSVQRLLEELASKDWIKVCESLNNTRRFAVHHSSLLLPILEKLMVVMVKAMKNPRSALCKTSIMACSDIFKAFAEKLTLLKTMDDLLLMKASQDKKFVCEEADKALNTMVNSVSRLSLLRKLKAYVRHSNPRVRAKAAVSTSNCVSKMEVNEMEEFGMVMIAQMAADLLNDKLPEAREAARSMVNSVYEKFTWNEEEEGEEGNKQEAWQRFCEKNLTGLNAQAMIKIVSSQ
ncbi:TOG array regulator of axonemal microtubules protein 1-like isoform X2 [Brassica napus]|uniref:TOG array regulator of axonemal microtubules protein 1-like isoform X2 n=1 Tax=Brassica napus TaxID=3708 RepID=UPI00207A1308|nr:TOG array regulator of axonemal microtubules protein 1-like isoform X2 [Brassica napus]